MKLLTFLAREFAWKSFSKTLPDAPTQDVSERVQDAVVVFMHIEARDAPGGTGGDAGGDARKRCFRHALKHIKWLAGKRDLKRVVLHSFTHLGGDTAPAEFARAFMEDLATRLRATEYQVWLTPFGYFCSWNLDVYGESLAKVWKEI